MSKNIAKLFSLFVVLLSLVIGLSMFAAVYSYHSDTKKFWGPLYEPDTPHVEIFDDFPLSWIMLEGGPLGNPEYFEVCHDTAFSMVPIRHVSDDKFEALCGFEETIIETFYMKDENLITKFTSDK